MTTFQPSDWLLPTYIYPFSHMISINNSDWLIPMSHCYFCTIYTWAYFSGMQIADLAPFSSLMTRMSNEYQYE